MSSSFGSPTRPATEDESASVPASTGESSPALQTTTSSSSSSSSLSSFSLSSSDTSLSLSLGQFGSPELSGNATTSGPSTTPSNGFSLSLNSDFSMNDRGLPPLPKPPARNLSSRSSPAFTQSGSELFGKNLAISSSDLSCLSTQHGDPTTELSFNTSSGSAFGSSEHSSSSTQQGIAATGPSFITSSASAFGSFRTRSLGSMISTTGSIVSDGFSFPSPVARTSQDPSSIFAFPTSFSSQSSQASPSTPGIRRILFRSRSEPVASVGGESTTAATDNSRSIQFDEGNVLSVSANPTYMNQSHEELRWEHYQNRNRGNCFPNGSFHHGQCSSGHCFLTISWPAFSMCGFGNSSLQNQSSAFGLQSSSGNCFPATPSPTFCTCGFTNNSLQNPSSAFGSFHPGQSSSGNCFPATSSPTFCTCGFRNNPLQNPFSAFGSFHLGQSSTPPFGQSNTFQVSSAPTGFGQLFCTGFPLVISLNNTGALGFGQTTIQPPVIAFPQSTYASFPTINCPHCTATHHCRNGSNSSGGT